MFDYEWCDCDKWIGQQCGCGDPLCVIYYEPSEHYLLEDLKGLPAIHWQKQHWKLECAFQRLLKEFKDFYYEPCFENLPIKLTLRSGIVIYGIEAQVKFKESREKLPQYGTPMDRYESISIRTSAGWKVIPADAIISVEQKLTRYRRLTGS